MSAARFTIEVSAAELEVVSLALGRMLDAKPVRERAATKPATTLPVFSTGDARLDAFMRRTWKPEHAIAAQKRRLVGIPARASSSLKPRKWTSADHYIVNRFNEVAVAEWRRRGHVVVIEGDRIDPNAGNVTVYPLGESPVKA